MVGDVFPHSQVMQDKCVGVCLFKSTKKECDLPVSVKVIVVVRVRVSILCVMSPQHNI